MSLSSDHDVKLKTTENAWKPKRLDSAADKSEEETHTEELYKNVRGILNKLTPQKFDTLIKKFCSLPISSETRLQGVIKLIFEQAVGEPRFSTVYANMCKVCSKLEVPKEMKAENAEKKKEKVSLRKLLINRCQQEFESNSKADLNIAKWLEDINNCADPEKKEELQANFDESERNIRMKSVGNIRFIGELFKFGMLTPAIMYRCIEKLLSCTEEESLECLCTLLTTIGKDLENLKSANPGLNPHFAKMVDLAQKKENSKVSSRVRFMLRDVIDLRNSKWVPRREDSNSTTIEQINKEAERESIASMALNQPAPNMRPTYHPCFSYYLSAGGYPEEQMADDELMIFEEYLQDLYSIEDIKLDLEQYYTRGWIARFVEKALSICLDKKPPAQNKIGGLLAALLDYNIIPVSVFVIQLGFIYEMMDDIAIYDPRVWKLQAHFLVPIIAAEEFNFGHFKEACKHIQRTNTVPKLLVPVLQFLSKAKGEGFAKKIWDLSNVSIKDFMAEDGADVNAFIKEHSLDFLVGEAPKCDQTSFD